VFVALKVGYGVGPSAATTSTNVRIQRNLVARVGSGEGPEPFTNAAGWVAFDEGPRPTVVSNVRLK
jgi:hypothetical protein